MGILTAAHRQSFSTYCHLSQRRYLKGGQLSTAHMSRGSSSSLGGGAWPALASSLAERATGPSDSLQQRPTSCLFRRSTVTTKDHPRNRVAVARASPASFCSPLGAKGREPRKKPVATSYNHQGHVQHHDPIYFFSCRAPREWCALWVGVAAGLTRLAQLGCQVPYIC